ncbi:Maf family protein [Kordiimonas sediminis]|uniref:Maf family protein n=1 Tax=Kordiimonas sediminis TaxID=1735581 RepID=UPI003571406F
MNVTPPVILASGSSTRLKMLQNAGVKLDSMPAAIDEEAVKIALCQEGAAPRETVDALAELKSLSVSRLNPGALVIGSDQILVHDGKILSKCSSLDEARQTLSTLSDSMHTLMSAAVISLDGRPVWRSLDAAKLTVRPLSDTFIVGYVAEAGEAILSSVGCYHYEGLGAQLFSAVEGDYYTILGMPLLPVLDFLRRYGVLAV